MKLALFTFIAAMPILAWAYVFHAMRPEKKSTLFWAFIAGCFSPIIVLLYQKFWGDTMNLLFFEVTPINFKTALSGLSTEYFMQKFLVFVFGVGMMEEFVKHFVIRKEKPVGLVILFILGIFFSLFYGVFQWIFGTLTPLALTTIVGLWMTFYIFIKVHKKLDFQSIDQVILVSIMSALGFSFIENIVYVMRLLDSASATSSVVIVLMIRSLFVVMVHMLCSGIFGYYYGISLFAGPYLQEHESSGRKFFLLRWLRAILRFSKKTIYREEKLLEGLIISMLVHGLYDFILEVNLTFGELVGFFGIQSSSNFPLYTVIMVAYLMGGFMWLSHLLQEKENHLKFGLVGTKVMPEEDYVELLKTVKKYEHEKQVEGALLEKGWGSKKELGELQKQIAYLEKYKLLEDKYLNTKWMTAEDLMRFRKDIQEIKHMQNL